MRLTPLVYGFRKPSRRTQNPECASRASAAAGPSRIAHAPFWRATIALTAALCASSFAVALAAPPAPTASEVATQIRQLLGAGKAGEAYTAAQAAVRAHADNADVLSIAAAVFVQLFDHAAAEKSARLALAVAPANGTAHYVLGEMLARQGKLEEAIAALRKAASDAATSGDARVLIAELEEQRAVLASPTPRPSPATPEHPVGAFIEAVRAENLARAFGLATSSLRAAIESKLGPIGGSKVAGFSRGLAQSLTRQRARLLGYTLSARVPDETAPDRVQVRAALLARTQLDHKGIDLILRFAREPTIKTLIEPELGAILGSLAASQQRAFLERVSAQPLRRMTAWVFELRRDGERWAIDDVRDEGESPRTLRALLGALPAIERAVERTHGRKRSAYEQGQLVGYGVGILLVVAGLVWYVLRQRRKMRLDPPLPPQA